MKAEGDVRPKSEAAQPSTFRASHFFILASLMAATVAVIISRQSTPEHLVLISLTIGAAGLAAAGLYRVLSPLVGDGAAASSEPLTERARAGVEREKLLLLRALKDLEFDRAMGKVSGADFEQMAARLRGRALSLMKQLDEDGTGYRTLIERELKTRLDRDVKARPASKPDEPPTAAVAVVDAPPARRAGVCACGTTNDGDAIFCKRCGARLDASDAAAE
jgi:hypothetical protein